MCNRSCPESYWHWFIKRTKLDVFRYILTLDCTESWWSTSSKWLQRIRYSYRWRLLNSKYKISREIKRNIVLKLTIPYSCQKWAWNIWPAIWYRSSFRPFNLRYHYRKIISSCRVLVLIVRWCRCKGNYFLRPMVISDCRKGKLQLEWRLSSRKSYYVGQRIRELWWFFNNTWMCLAGELVRINKN